MEEGTILPQTSAGELIARARAGAAAMKRAADADLVDEPGARSTADALFASLSALADACDALLADFAALKSQPPPVTAAAPAGMTAEQRGAVARLFATVLEANNIGTADACPCAYTLTYGDLRALLALIDRPITGDK